jgi:hypothetical protein
LKLIPPGEFEVEYKPFWNRDIVIIGRGKLANLYQYKNSIPTFTINTAIEFYKNPWYTVMLEAHFRELKDIDIIQNQNIIFIKKREMQEMQLVYGCTPSIFISYMIKRMNKGTSIYLQGFSMDEIKNTKYPTYIRRNQNYDWNRQIGAFKKCKILADALNIKLKLINETTKLSFIQHENPPKEIIVNG